MAATNVQAFSGDVEITSNLEVGTANLFVDTVNGRVGIGTNPSDALHVYGSPFIQHGISYQQTTDNSWYAVGTWEVPSGDDGNAANLKLTFLGGRGYASSLRQGAGESVIYARILNNNDGSLANITGSWKHEGSDVIFSNVKFKQVGTNRYKYQVCVNLKYYTRHTMKVECSRTSSFTREFTDTSDPGSDSATVQQAVVLPITSKNGNFGIGTNSPSSRLHVGDGSNPPAGTVDADASLTLNGAGRKKVEQGKPGIYHRENVGLGLHSDFKMSFEVGGSSTLVEAMRIDNTGLVGIGTTNPGSLLTFYKDYPVPSAGSEPALDYTQGITFRSDLNSYASGGVKWNNSSLIDAAKIWYQPASYNAVGSNSAGVHGKLNFGVGYFATVTNTPSMTITSAGNVGIGTTSPGAALDIYRSDNSEAIIRLYGQTQGTGRLYVGQSPHYGGGIEYNGDNNPTSTGAGSDYVTLFRVSNDTHYWTARCHYNFNQWEFITTINNSDDRVKENETYIRGATDTLMKIKPQLYDKKPSIESTDTKEWLCESGLIAQELYYDVPELRHLVKIPRDARDIDANISVTSDDPTVDPDYSAWGKDTSAVNYIGLIPYLIKSVQEITTELPRHKTPVSNITPQNVNDFVGLIVSKRGTVELSTKSEDKACYGVISEITCDTQNNEILVNSSGEGKIWVTNLTGNVEAGDLITTSNIAGYGQLQNSPVLSNFTVAKLTEDCDFNPPSIPVRRIRQEMSNVTVYSITREVRVTEEEYNELTEEDRTTENRITYYDGDRQIDFDEYSNLESNTLRTETTLVFKLIHRHTSRTMREGYTPEVRQELVNVLDEHGQIQWEDDPSGATEKAYKIRYLDADGNVTDEANHVHKAAFVGCTYHCG